MLRLLLLLLRLLLLLLLLLPLLLLLLLLFLKEFVVASFGVKSKLTPSFFSNPLPPSPPQKKQTLFLDPPPSLTLSCSSHTPSYTSHTMPAASCQGDPHSKDPFSAAAAAATAAAAAARKEPPRKKPNKLVTLKMKQKISNTKIQFFFSTIHSQTIPRKTIQPPPPPPAKPSNRPAPHLPKTIQPPRPHLPSRARAQSCGHRSLCPFLLDVERRWRSHSAEGTPQKAPRGPFHRGPFSPFKRTVGEADRPAPLFLTRKIT